MEFFNECNIIQPDYRSAQESRLMFMRNLVHKKVNCLRAVNAVPRNVAADAVCQTISTKKLSLRVQLQAGEGPSSSLAGSASGHSLSLSAAEYPIQVGQNDSKIGDNGSPPVTGSAVYFGQATEKAELVAVRESATRSNLMQKLSEANRYGRHSGRQLCEKETALLKCKSELAIMDTEMQGVPMMTMGDEYAHTKGGNNNTYCHDNDINYFRWDKKEADPAGFYRFTRLILNFRRKCEALGLSDFPNAETLQWHGILPEMPDWSEKSRFVAFTLVDDVHKELYIVFNGSHMAAMITLPERQGSKWQPLVDTSKVSPYDFLSEDVSNRATASAQYKHFLNSNIYPMLSYSSIILELLPEEL